jgi:carbonic anhydrase
MTTSFTNDVILERLRRFRAESFARLEDEYRSLVEVGQRPRALYVGCSDSRVVPHMLADAAPGELFVTRNVGAIVPPYDAPYNSTGAAIEYAVLVLDVRHIIVCGHSHCGAIRALYHDPKPETPHLASWIELAREAALPVMESEEALRRTEQRGVMLALERLVGYPMVAERMNQGTLTLHGWHYVIEEGHVHVLDLEGGNFVDLLATT